MRRGGCAARSRACLRERFQLRWAASDDLRWIERIHLGERHRSTGSTRPVNPVLVQRRMAWMGRYEKKTEVLTGESM